MRQLAITLALLLSVCFAGLGSAPLAAEEEKAEDPRLSIPESSYRPGATMLLQAEIQSPEGWHLNSLVPLLISFDREGLKKLPFSVTKDRWEFTLKADSRTFTAQLPFQVAAKASDGQYVIPLRLECGICDDSGGACTFADDKTSFVLRIRAVAPKSDKNQAQAKGVISLSHTAVVPE